MRYSLLFALTLILLVGGIMPCCGQKQLYNVVSKGDTIGELKVTKAIKGNHIVYRYVIDLTITVLIDVVIKYDLEATYNPTQLLHAKIQNTVNGRPQHTCDIKWNDNHYLINTEDIKSKKHYELIKYSNILLFFQEPIGITKVFSEFYGQYSTLKVIKQGQYEVTLPNGKKNMYHYKNGKMYHAIINNSMVKFQMFAKQTSN